MYMGLPQYIPPKGPQTPKSSPDRNFRLLKVSIGGLIISWYLETLASIWFLSKSTGSATSFVTFLIKRQEPYAIHYLHNTQALVQSFRP